MTLNVPVNQNGIPLSVPNQIFILQRPNVEFQVKIQGLGKKTAKGIAYLTCFRIIFVPNKHDNQFYSFDIPIFSLYQESVEFPIFGSTYLKGKTPPFQNLLPGTCQFKLWFQNGGCDTFIKILSSILTQLRKHNKNQVSFIEKSNMYNDMRQGKFNYNGFVDPSDPSKIYLVQPNQKN